MKKNHASGKTPKRPVTLTRFEALVRDVVRGLPQEFKEKLENVNVVIQKEPSALQKKAAGIGKDEDLLGLYEGVPLGERTHFCGNVLPDKITVFRGPITRSCRNRRQMGKMVRDTVLHEFAHYFGISDEHMLEDGTY